MKKIFITLCAAFALVACSDRLNPEIQPVEQSLVFTGRIDDATTRTAIERASGKVEWLEGDLVDICGITYVAHPDAQDASRATFTKLDPLSRNPGANWEGYYVAKYGNVLNQVYDAKGSNCPMTAISETTELTFKNDCGVLRLNVKADGKKIVRVKAGTYGLDCGEGVDITNATDFYIALPEGDYENLKVYFFSEGNEKSLKTYNGSLSVAKNQIIPITFPVALSFVDNNSQMKGIFSVSYQDKVQFSPGTLQYQGSTREWRFAPNQYDVIGNAPGNSVKEGRESQADWIDLFGWSATGLNEIGTDPSDLSFDNSHFRSEATATATEVLRYSNKSDWGYAYFVCNGEKGWYTLSYDEWNFLVNTRPASTINGVENARYAYAKVDGHVGLFLLPDVFEWNEATMGPVPAKINQKVSDWNGTDYTLEQFEAIEGEGVVFLPGPGYMTKNGFSGPGTYGCYWSRTATAAGNAYTFEFDSGNFKFVKSNRSSVSAVRLVKSIPTTYRKEPLPGKFSISSIAKVQFSPGNLQYQASTDTWRFAREQYCYIGFFAGNALREGRDTQEDWIDQFGWGSSGLNEFGAKPHEGSTDNALYKTLGAPMAKEKLTYGNKADWGYAYGIANNEDGWFTMTTDEFLYLINTRKASTVGTVEDARFAKVNVCRHYCMAIFPDEFTWDESSMGPIPSNINKNTATWDSTRYTESQFKAMEQAGVAFLPVSGYYTTSFQSVGNEGDYWTSNGISSTSASIVYFHSSKAQQYEMNRRDHCCVRLVKLCDYNGDPGSIDARAGSLSDYPKEDFVDE